jgi:DNA adenine methylase
MGSVKLRKPVPSQSRKPLEISELAINPRPFLRWAGGKRTLAPLIEQTFPFEFRGTTNSFFEPFVGGGALNLYLGNRNLRNYVPGSSLYINDLNPDLIITYKVIRDSVEDLIKTLKAFSTKLGKEDFIRMRKYNPTSEVKRAARFIYLNKTCFNGLWRVNGKGEFNVPWGKLKSPKIFDANELRVVSLRLQKSKISCTNFTTAVGEAKKGDLVYFDPPYIPLSSSASFSKYAKDDFGVMDHFALAGVIQGLNSKGVHVVLSNSDTPLSREIYGSLLELKQVNVNRSISASSTSRISVNELIGVNFEITKESKLNKLRAV